MPIRYKMAASKDLQ